MDVSRNFEDDIKVENLSFSYVAHDVLKEVSFSVKKGEITSLIGPNATGKTTLLKCIAGIYENYRGDIFIGNSNLKILSKKKRARKLSFVTQREKNSFSYSILDYVAMGRSPYQNILNALRPEDYERARNVLDMLGIKDYEKKSFKETSSGEGHLVNFARAVNQDTEIMLLDEPTSYLDFKNQNLMFSLIKRFCREFKKTILMTLHNPNEVLNISDNVVLLKEGKVLDSGKKDKVISPQVLSLLFGFDVEINKIKSFYFVLPVNNLS
jgi:iron complex transport system ATP-binding protein